jgi:starch synthase
MEILMASAELGPYVRETDAADAVASLAKALRQLGHNVTVVVPRQPGFEAAGLLLARRLTPLPLPSGAEVPVLDASLPSGVKLTLFDAPVLFDRPGVYGDQSGDYADNAQRFTLFAQATAALVSQREQQGKAFDIVHAHDGAAALVPAILERTPGPSVPAILTIHDVTRACRFPAKEGVLPPELENDEALRLDGDLCFLKAGVVYANAVTTVSPTYATDLQSEAVSGPLAGHFAEGEKNVVGVTNGIDYALYNPATDSALPNRYDAEDSSQKALCKAAVLRAVELDLDIERPLVAFIGDLDEQTGFDLVLVALPQLLRQDLALVIAGTHDAAMEKKLVQAQGRHRDRFALVSNPDAALSRRLYAAADIALIPSRRAPCGTRQLIAMRYGALPVARATGGLTDTIVDVDAELTTGTGVLFDEDSADALAGAVGRALAAYASPHFADLRRRMMRQDLGWDRPARRYLQIYRHALAQAR